MFADPIVVAANSPNPALNFDLIRSDGYGSERRDSGGLYSLIVNHSTGKQGSRHYMKIVKTIDATNPYSGLVSPQSASVSIAFASPAYGFTTANMSSLWIAMYDTLGAAGVSPLLNFES